MPPLEFAPNSHFAARGSSEADELYSRAVTGEFLVYSADDDYLVFTHREDNPAEVIAAFIMEADTAVYAQLEYDALSSETLESQVFPDRVGKAQSFLSKLVKRFKS